MLTNIGAWLTDPAHWTGPGGIPQRILEHLVYSGVSLLIAAAIAESTLMREFIEGRIGPRTFLVKAGKAAALRAALAGLGLAIGREIRVEVATALEAE